MINNQKLWGIVLNGLGNLDWDTLIFFFYIEEDTVCLRIKEQEVK